MKIGTILFTYHRSEHTKKVIQALSENELLPEKLYIFQDGIKENTNYTEWEKVNEAIKNVDWCEKELHISEKNKGLARSITEGICYVLQECDAVIVLEDDCVPSKHFMQFMVSALDKYRENERVYSVSGYAWNVNLIQEKEDAYFNGRICSYGWGTWKERWTQYEEDYHILTKIKKDPEAIMRLQIWGQDLEGMVVGNVLDRCDSWAVFWALKVIQKGGYCLSPYKQLIHNIGFDGSGVHSSKLQKQHIELNDQTPKIFQFPQKMNISKECEEEFKFLFGGKKGEEKLKLYEDLLLNWIKMKQRDKTVSIPKVWNDDIAVWGKGKIFDCLFNEIFEKVHIKYIIESNPSDDEYKGIPIVSIDRLPQHIKNIVVIPYFDLEIIKTKVQKIRDDIYFWGIDELLS